MKRGEFHYEHPQGIWVYESEPACSLMCELDSLYDEEPAVGRQRAGG